MSQLHFAYHPKFENDSQFKEIFDEFCYYKENSEYNEHPSPTRHTQETYECFSPLFGRDRFDKKYPEASNQNIQHLHVRQSKSVWDFPDGAAKAQWECTSDSYLVYSYFMHEGFHHYFVIEFYISGGHAQYEQDVQIFIHEAEQYRLSKINKTA